ncbi:TRAP transporter substrate-binding protein [Aliamphritea hakodatensis]|uniref:TRAP transporter substrate-binding protein n=1 Tax=Aliamphritea hakodatensis TaxID=2895352 RepID=UPI0022FD47CE|nr:TRAP transporter substrate-binding protein DctP [Aliamphritea hakodatensis]
MNRKKIKGFFKAVSVITVATAVLLSPFSTTAVLAAKKTINVGILAGTDDEDYDGAMVLKDYVESRTNGDISVRIFPAGQFCSSYRECLESIQNGTLQATITTIGGFGNLFPPGQVMDLPYAFKNDRVAECVFDGPFVTQLRDGVLSTSDNVRLMTISNTGGWRNFATTGKQIKTPADLKGLKIRTIPADIQKELVVSLGANATPIAWPEVYTSLATGVVEGTKNGITDIVNMKFQDHIKYITLDGHAYMGSLWWMNNSFWSGLSEPEKRIVYDGFQHLKGVTRAFPMRRQIEAYDEFRKAGGTVYVPTPEEKRLFRSAAKPMEAWYINNYGTEWLDNMQSAIRTCEAAIDAEI